VLVGVAESLHHVDILVLMAILFFKRTKGGIQL